MDLMKFSTRMGKNVTTDYTITNGKNAMSAGPITIDSGVTVTVGAGETLTRSLIYESNY